MTALKLELEEDAKLYYKDLGSWEKYDLIYIVKTSNIPCDINTFCYIKNYECGLMPYKMPSKLAEIIMKRMFKSNELTRKIMQLHNNVEDLIYVCKSVYETGEENGISTPLLSEKYERYFLNLNIK